MIRILHVIGGMDRAGSETWLMNVLRNIDRDKFQMDFLVHSDRRFAYSEEIESLGSRVIYCPSPCKPLVYGLNFLRILHRDGPYQVVHAHLHHFNAFALILAALGQVPVRITHSHLSTTEIDREAPLPRKAWLRVAQALIRMLSSTRLAASKQAGESLFGTGWLNGRNSAIVYYGLDFEAFDAPVDRQAVRAEFGLKPEDFVIGHVGRFVPQKNHAFLLRIFSEVAALNPNARLLLAGEGPLLESSRDLAARLGVSDRVIFAGVRPDIARLMLGAMDHFLFPSLYEGLGLVAVEAQAAGLPVTASDRVPSEADLGCGLMQVMRIKDDAGAWARRILEHSGRQLCSRDTAAEYVKTCRFHLPTCVDALTRAYRLGGSDQPENTSTHITHPSIGRP